MHVIQSNDLVAYEDLKVKNMVRNNRLSKSINDAAWSMFRQWLEYFGSKYGKVTVAVPPHNTSQECSNCGTIVKKTLSQRTHSCPHCKFVEDRDVNAALNILKRGLRTVGHTGTVELDSRNACSEVECTGSGSNSIVGEMSSGLIGAILSGDDDSLNQESPRL